MADETATDAFPVQWDDPADAETCWQYDPEHTPGAIEPLAFDLGLGPFIEGFGWGLRPRVFNYYPFFRWQQRAAASGEDAPPSASDFERLREAGRRWEDEILPEVLGHIERFRTADFAAMSNEQLAEEIERLPELRRRSGELHTLSITPPHMALTALMRVYHELTGGDELSAIRLVQGYGNKSVEAGDALWRLSRIAANLPSVKERILALEDGKTAQMLDELRRDADARPFVEALDSFLEEFGWRSGASLFGVTWVEDPSVPLTMLRAYLETEGYDPAEERRRLAEERDGAVEQALAGLDGDGRERLRDAIDTAKEVLHLTEDHNFYIDQRLYTMPRRLVLEAGRRLASAGVVAEPGDVFFLHLGEFCAALRGDSAEVSALSAQRRREFDRWRQVKPPAYVGAPPPKGAEPRPPASRPERTGDLTGTGASAGVARGPVRVVRTLDEAGRLRPGDVLVTRVTLPPWTPLFAVACAVVTEVGGMLGHTATVAREYGIPAVLAVRDATFLLQDGQLAEVDGSRGVVRVVG